MVIEVEVMEAMEVEVMEAMEEMEEESAKAEGTEEEEMLWYRRGIPTQSGRKTVRCSNFQLLHLAGRGNHVLDSWVA